MVHDNNTEPTIVIDSHVSEPSQMGSLFLAWRVYEQEKKLRELKDAVYSASIFISLENQTNQAFWLQSSQHCREAFVNTCQHNF